MARRHYTRPTLSVVETTAPLPLATTVTPTSEIKVGQNVGGSEIYGDARQRWGYSDWYDDDWGTGDDDMYDDTDYQER